MSDAPNQPLRVLGIIGSLNQKSVTRIVILHVAGLLRDAGCEVDVVDFTKEPLALFNPDSAYASVEFAALKRRVEVSDVYLVGTPDYHGSMSSTAKNFLDHFWQEFAGKLFATTVASHEKGLTVLDQLRTVARQCYAWSLPYGVSFSDRDDIKEGRVTETFAKRLAMFAHDIRVYGGVIANQRRADLAGIEPGFMARYRK
jgi:NAD(P)H-dependent FMN reductase